VGGCGAEGGSAEVAVFFCCPGGVLAWPGGVFTCPGGTFGGGEATVVVGGGGEVTVVVGGGGGGGEVTVVVGGGGEVTVVVGGGGALLGVLGVGVFAAGAACA
jgi:hypothetical protein